jgi:Carboxypeptidase regulatory-like domain
MKQQWWKTACCCAAFAVAAQGQAPLSVGYQKRVQFAVSGATAAYSLDSNIADAGAANGIVEILGKAPGATNIIVVTAFGVQSMAVTVPAPPPNLPPGFEPPWSEGSAGENGNYELRYNSDPGQITNALQMKRTQGQSFERLQLVNANLFSAGSSQSTVGFPWLAYEIGRTGYDVTFLDQNVINSPLTLDNDLVRGFHLRAGTWQFHGGFTSIAMFQGLFLSTEREYVAGASRSFVLDRNTSFESNLYYFRNPVGAQVASSNGVVGSLVYRLQRTDRMRFLAELGASRGLGLALRGSRDSEKTHIQGNFHTQSRSFASLAINTQHGTFTTLDASRKLNPRLYATLNLNQSNYNLPALQQNTFTSGELLNLKLKGNFSLSGGFSYSSFHSLVPLSNRISTVNLPARVDFSTRHFGAGFEYQRTMISGGSGGNDYAVNARASAGEFHGSVFYRHDVQAPTLAAIFSQVPGLQGGLQRAGIVAATPDQLAALLSNAAILGALGFSTPLTVNLAPARNDFEASLAWFSRGRSRRQADLSYFSSNTELVQGKFALSTFTVSYAQRLSANNSIVGSAAMVRITSSGATSTRPLLSISLQHRFFTVPGLLLPGRSGLIEGHVFRDDDSRSLYMGQAAVAGVEVRLDEERVTHSDANGYYSFHHVPYGVHRIEARYQSDQPFFYTTDSPATTDINSTVDFGINFAKGQIIGFLLNDAGGGVGGITVKLQATAPEAQGESLSPNEKGLPFDKGAQSEKGVEREEGLRDEKELQDQNLTRRTQTGDNGKFSFAGLAPGTYMVSTPADSYPPGYSLQALAPQTVTVAPAKPASVQFAVRALRSLAGKVVAYDSQTLQPVPLGRVTIRLKELALEARTSENGAYVFRNLPAGTYTLSVEYGGKETTRTVTLPPQPASLRDVDLNAGTR